MTFIKLKQLLSNYWIKSENSLKDDLNDILLSIDKTILNYDLVDNALLLMTNASKLIKDFFTSG